MKSSNSYAIIKCDTILEQITWEKCTLRTWLNSTFLKKAFSIDEQKAVVATDVDNRRIQCNSSWSSNGGNNTRDKIFLLSYMEVEKYFGSDDSRICKPTEFAIAQGLKADDSGNCSWLLRSPGASQDSASGVISPGSIGYCIDVNHASGVRPVLWIHLE